MATGGADRGGGAAIRGGGADTRGGDGGVGRATAWERGGGAEGLAACGRGAARWFCGLNCSRVATGGDAVGFVEVTAGLPVGVAVGAVTAAGS
jgi:hypothetical protein